MHPRPDDYFFTGSKGSPTYTRDWAEDYGFYDVLRRLNIRQRKFYCTRHTSISWQLTHGTNPFGVARYHGTSLQMIERHYGEYIPESGLDPAIFRVFSDSKGQAKIATFREQLEPEDRTLNRTLSLQSPFSAKFLRNLSGGGGIRTHEGS